MFSNVKICFASKYAIIINQLYTHTSNHQKRAWLETFFSSFTYDSITGDTDTNMTRENLCKNLDVQPKAFTFSNFVPNKLVSRLINLTSEPA